MNAVDLLDRAIATGVHLSIDDAGQIRYRGPNEAVRAIIPELRRHKPALVDVLRSWRELERAVDACCALRSDSPENRAALLAGCWQEPAADWPWLAWYFGQETARWTH